MAGYRQVFEQSMKRGLSFVRQQAWDKAAAEFQRALAEFLPKVAVDPDRISGVDDVMADAVTFKYISTPLTKQQLGELIQIPEHK